MAGKPIPTEDLKRLRKLGKLARTLRYVPGEQAEKVRFERDSLVHRLARDGVSPTELAWAAGIDRTLVYRYKDDERLQ